MERKAGLRRGVGVGRSAAGSGDGDREEHGFPRETRGGACSEEECTREWEVRLRFTGTQPRPLVYTSMLPPHCKGRRVGATYHVAHKDSTSYYLILYRKCLPTPG